VVWVGVVVRWEKVEEEKTKAGRGGGEEEEV
jgi:hypothetical protein